MLPRQVLASKDASPALEKIIKNVFNYIKPQPVNKWILARRYEEMGHAPGYIALLQDH
jgi:hypothetical protein